MDVYLINTNLSDEIQISIYLIETKSFSAFWSFGENYMRMYRDGRQIFESPQEVHKRGRLKIK
jgi:hypothetical protein